MNKPIKVMTIFGTRPEAIKMAPLVLELQKYPEAFESIVTVTAQHRQMLDQVLSIFGITPDYDLNIMKERQTLVDVTTRGLEGLDKVMKEVKPDIVLVHGDTTTTFIASLAAFYNQIVVGHVEAGLRTWNKYSPYPEEMNRQLTGVIADLHFSPTTESAENLRQENKQEESIFITGNTAIDALKTTVKEEYHHEILSKLGDDRLILLTAHRRENLGEPMRNMFRAVKRIVEEQKDVQVIYPVHLNPVVREIADEILGDDPRIHLIEPLDVIDFHNFASRAYLILTDSGGVQEEAPSLGVPVLVLRDTTERPEGIEAGTLKLAGVEEETIYQLATELLTDKAAYEKMAKAVNPYGDGEASHRICEAIRYYFNQTAERPEPYHPLKN
ncbi:non-hydrolyzing UDP-N-acetylglucosamine 2-epimerase [Robertmurraya andreesenii]|uniref:UDP-N-acetylglucosamine 2-epimerase (non-hydrolyzing) n=1 Tax=Anoxybacillus andreesenii TaxID=1325932 RepID=A0ABT9V033_9BACL|nr:UDP-N-acetylglucosamine 2-epimerase (non-hydrolyzing) [Robertmurraya andreesenii]MDQ0154311.1 UDP-N-acetylglucosamine 2-epimerase (non-hydrolyzing) [Robertmurraya andreesenii]